MALHILDEKRQDERGDNAHPVVRGLGVKADLVAAFIEHVLARYGGTRIGRQEIDGEIVEERADALWTR